MEREHAVITQMWDYCKQCEDIVIVSKTRKTFLDNISRQNLRRSKKRLRAPFFRFVFWNHFCHQGGGGSRVPLTFSNFFVWKRSRITPWLPKRVLHNAHSLSFILCIYRSLGDYELDNTSKFASKQREIPSKSMFHHPLGFSRWSGKYLDYSYAFLSSHIYMYVSIV